MADRNWRLRLATVVLPLLFLAMSAMASAATLTVTNTHDTGTGSLRGQILAASSGDTINFSVSGTITLGSSLPAITAINLTIDGSGQSITVNGANSFQIFKVNTGATLILHNLTIAHGSIETSPFEGGAIFNHGTLTVTNCTFSDDIAPAFAGGIENEGTLTVIDSTFSGNRVNHEGGGIHNTGTLTVTNSTFVGNVADGDIGGGAIMNDDGATLKVTNSTFFENSAPFATLGGGGGINNSFGSATLKGTILADETGGNCGGFATPPVTDDHYNISDDGSCGFTEAAMGGTSINDSTTLHLDPAGLANNGGPTQTIALEPNSEAVDFIPIGMCTDQSSPTPLPLTTDQRGLPRPDPGNPDFCDAGAFELQTTPFVLAPNSERLQIARSPNPNSDQVNLAFTFIENGFPTCDAGNDAFNGFNVYLATGSCASLNFGGPVLFLDGWVVHTVNHQSYGTLFFDGGGTLSARMVELPTSPAPACGEWTVNIEIAGIDSAFLGNGPFALGLKNPDGDEGCSEITNAIVGSQIPAPGHGVRRGVRR